MATRQASPYYYATAGAASIALFLLVKPFLSINPSHSKVLPSPRATLLPRLSPAEARTLPYPPDVLPCARDVETPYGTLRVYEWGPEQGKKVLLVHGISTPCIALAGVAQELVRRGRRVMLFDLFGRGYSDAPADLPYDSRLYTTQILLALASSPLPWTGHANAFAIVGYSLGGGVAADFTSYFPHMISSLVLLAPSGILRESHISWKSRILYNSTGILPGRLLRWLVGRRLYTEPATANDAVEPEASTSASSVDKATQAEAGQRYHGTGMAASSASAVADDETSISHSFENIGSVSTPRRKSMASHPAQLIPGRPAITAANVVNWQLEAHPGFVPAFISSIRYAPVYRQHDRWRLIGARLDEQETHSADERLKRRGLERNKVLLVLGAADPIVVEGEVRRDVEETLGRGNVETVVFEAGHEVPMSMPVEVVQAMFRFWGDDVGQIGSEVETEAADLGI